MTANAYRLVPLLAALWLSACTTSPAVEALCGDGIDQDGDDAMDCEDSDCHASDDCVHSRAATVKPPPTDAAHHKPPVLEGGVDTPKDAQVGDAWTQADATLPQDARVPDDEDAGADPCRLCASNEACVAGRCQPAAAPTSGAYDLRVLMGTVPAMTEQTFCYDACLILAGVCPCLPDPYVRVVLVHDNSEQIVGVTGVVNETVTPTFPPMDFPIDLVAGDVLRFDVYDEDQPDRDNLLYTCNADLGSVSADAPQEMLLTCTFRWGFGDRVRFEIQAQLTPRPVP
jgi:hypothetical protein